MTPEGLRQMTLDAQEERGMAELAAVGAAPADWPNDWPMPGVRIETAVRDVLAGMKGLV
jgi:hypothetical protein